MTPNHDVVQKLLGALKSSQSRLEWFFDEHGGMGGDILTENSWLIYQTEAWLAGEPDPPSPTNACIRSAKRVIAALNLPEGAGVAFNADLGWVACTGEPKYGHRVWYPDGHEMYELPDTAIPPWPGDFRTSWITASTEEVTE